MVNMGALAVLVIILVFANFGILMGAQKLSNFTLFDSSRNVSCNATLDDKRGVPSGANPLHNK